MPYMRKRQQEEKVMHISLRNYFEFSTYCVVGWLSPLARLPLFFVFAAFFLRTTPTDTTGEHSTKHTENESQQSQCTRSSNNQAK